MGRYSDRWEESVNKYDKIGCCGNLVRMMLFLINTLFLLLGLVVFITAAILKWGKKSTFAQFTDIKGIDQVVSFGSINTISVILLILSSFIIVLSIVGLIAVKSLNKCFLIIYEIVVGVLFLAHLIAFFVLLFGSSSIEDSYKNGLTKQMGYINTDNSTKHDTACDIMKGLSELFDCCGAEKGPIDFNSTTLPKDCCATNGNSTVVSQIGCSEKSIKDVKDNATNLVVIPSAIILLVELFALIMVPCLVGKRT